MKGHGAISEGRNNYIRQQPLGLKRKVDTADDARDDNRDVQANMDIGRRSKSIRSDVLDAR